MTSFKNQKIAIIHDAIGSYGGSEKVIEVLSTMFPHADIITSFIDKESYLYKRIGHRVKKSLSVTPLLQWTMAKNFLKPFLYAYWEKLELNSYDIVITSSHAFSSKAVLTKPSTLHICYCYTPPKYLYTESSESKIRTSQHFLPHFLLNYARINDFIASQRPDILIAISHVVKKRIYKYYRRDAHIIYPPVYIPKNFHPYKKGNYFITVGRITKAKNTKLIVQTCTDLNLNLIVVGEGEDMATIKAIAGPSITFTGFVDEEEKQKLLKKAKAFIFAAEDEDFGIAPVEALSFGTPVIALKSGAMEEIVHHNKNGLLFSCASIPSLSKTLQEFEQKTFSQTLCYKSSTKFSEKRFSREFFHLLQQSI